MPRIDLAVPYAEKDLAKANGALWDKDKRVWYVPDGVDPKPLTRWLPRTTAELEQGVIVLTRMVEHGYGMLFAEMDQLRARLARLEADTSSPFQKRLRKAGHRRKIPR